MINPLVSLFNIQYPIIQAGMVWCSGWELAAAVSNAGGLGLIGSASMDAETLRTHIRKAKAATAKPFGVNVPLLYSKVEENLKVIIEENVSIVFTSAGNPAYWTGFLKSKGIKVAHVIANSKFAKKAEDAGVDAIVAEGVEAGGHNGREETTTFTLIPLIREITKLPLIAAGGIATGKGMLAAMVLGADGVQIGTRFIASLESSAHENFKKKILEAAEGDTKLLLKKVTPVRVIRNDFSNLVEQAENRGAGEEELRKLLGRGRSKLGMFEGNMSEGELESGQAACLIKEIKSAAMIVQDIMSEFSNSLKECHTKYEF